LEDWQIEFEWLRIRHFVKDSFKKDVLPDLNAVLLIIGIQEIGRWQKAYTKEEKQDLMHIAICTLLSFEGFYDFKGRDQDGWPHFELLKPIDLKGETNQEKLLIKGVIKYFKEYEALNKLQN
jgi:hypothetical protein